MIRNQKGSILVALILAIAVVAVSAGGYFYWQRQQALKSQSLTWEECTKIPNAQIQTSYPGRCLAPDGRSVTQPLSDEQKKNLQPPIPNETSNWKTFTGVLEFGSNLVIDFSLRYPPDWSPQYFEGKSINALRSKDYLVENWQIKDGAEIVINSQSLKGDELKAIDAKILSKDKIKIGQKEATSYILTGGDPQLGGGFGHEWRMISIDHEGGTVLIKFYWAPSYDKKVFDQILSTFKFL